MAGIIVPDSPLHVYILGRMEYREALALQMNLARERREERIPDILLLLEHPPVITLGKRGGSGDILLSREVLAAKGVDVVEIDRGGQVTYHGPGQMVGYFICNLYEHQRKVRLFVERIEQSVISFLRKEWDIPSRADRDNVGIWAGDEKIAAIGISIARGITMHGFALNITTDLSHFGWIVPCGITDKGVTSVEKLLASDSSGAVSVDMDSLKRRMAQVIQETFGYPEMSVFHGPPQPGF
ncbi:MAG: lipoyl(octanoyl) transferase LipB [Spirochaetales bacterium]|nr:lipoyl(octanoyl) transferase LipB [Spirochaetales bacterium]